MTDSYLPIGQDSSLPQKVTVEVFIAIWTSLRQLCPYFPTLSKNIISGNRDGLWHLEKKKEGGGGRRETISAVVEIKDALGEDRDETGNAVPKLGNLLECSIFKGCSILDQ